VSDLDGVGDGDVEAVDDGIEVGRQQHVRRRRWTHAEGSHLQLALRGEGASPYGMGYPWTPESMAKALPPYALRASTPETTSRLFQGWPSFYPLGYSMPYGPGERGGGRGGEGGSLGREGLRRSLSRKIETINYKRTSEIPPFTFVEA
jgi:hypothetical protein